MGRGDSSRAARSAQGLLFGPRNLVHTGSAIDQEAISSALAELEDNNPALAIELVAEWSDKHYPQSKQADHLIEQLALRSDRFDEQDWNYLIESLDNHLKNPLNTEMLSPLVKPLAKRIINQSQDRLIGGSEIESKLLLHNNHPFANQLSREWAHAFPYQGFQMGIGKEFKLTPEKRLACRQGFYQAALDSRSEVAASFLQYKDILCPQIKEDLASGQADDLVKALQRDCQEGAWSLIGRENLSTFDDELFISLIESMPDKERRQAEQMIKDFVSQSLSNSQGAAARLADSVGLSEQSREELLLKEAAWKKRAGSELAEKILAGRRSSYLRQYRYQIGDMLAKEVEPENLDRLPLMHRSGGVNDPNSDWQFFKTAYLKRPLAPDRKLTIEQDDWSALITSALIDRDHNPFVPKIDRQRLISNLSNWAASGGLSKN